MKLKDLREEAGMTQKQLAEKIGNVQRNISNWESGNSQPDLDTIVRLAELFGVTTDELLGRTNEFGKIDDVTFHGSPLYDEETEKIAELADKLTSGQKKALIAFLKSLSAEEK